MRRRGIDIGNAKSLRVVQTVRNLNELTSEISKTNHIIFQRVTRNPSFETERMLLRSYADLTIVDVPSRSFHRRDGWHEYSEEEWELVYFFKSYSGNNSDEGWAAYLVPKDAEVGERFYISELIEDVVAEEFWDSIIPAIDGEAIWSGKSLDLDASIYDEQFMVG